MTQLIVTTRSGAVRTLDVTPGSTVMEAIRDAGIGELLALCGGALSCATCHVQVDPAFAGALPSMSEDENDLLDASSHRNAQSRLSCQLRLDNTMTRLNVTIAEED